VVDRSGKAMCRAEFEALQAEVRRMHAPPAQLGHNSGR